VDVAHPGRRRRQGVGEREEERTYYQSHAGEFTTPSAITIREILVEVEPSTGPGGQPAINVGGRRGGQGPIRGAAGTRRVAGEDFGEIASKESSAASEGQWRADWTPEHRRTGARPSGDHRAVEGWRGVAARPHQRGYQLFKLESATPDHGAALRQARDQIAEKVYGQKRGTALRAYLVKLRGQAIIEWKSDEAKKLYDKVLAQVPSTQS